MMDCAHFMSWNMATYQFMDFFNAWEYAERQGPYRRWMPHAKFRHRPREWQLEGNGPGAKLVPYDLAPVDPRMSSEERSWATWGGKSCLRRPVDYMAPGRRSSQAQVRTPEQIEERDNKPTNKKWSYNLERGL